MIIDLITIFPEMIRNYFSEGILSRACSQGLINIEAYDLRDYAQNKYKKIDDYVFGHGRGMLFQAPPLKNAILAMKKKQPNSRVVYLSPQGRKLNNKIAREFSQGESIILLSARYEGIDARIVESLVDEEISIGDYVLTGGELPALVFIDAVSRCLTGTIQKSSVDDESFENGLVEYAHYTEPLEFDGINVPDVLRSGNHKLINEFRLYSSLRNTYFNRPDLLLDYNIPQVEIESKNRLRILQKQNKNFKYFLKIIRNISKEWRDGRRNKKARRRDKEQRSSS